MFQKQTETFVEVIKTPLIGLMTSSAMSKVIRGPTQSLLMEPALHSIDPDYPDIRVTNM